MALMIHAMMIQGIAPGPDVASVGQAIEQAVVILASPKTVAHSLKLRLVVMTTLVRS